MKLRIKGNSLRLRLTQTEVRQFGEGEIVEETIHFGGDAGAKMTYALQRTSAEEISAQYEKNRIQVNVPLALVEEWTCSSLVGLKHQMPIGTTETLSILIEKDFKCLQVREGEVEEDMFPNPDEGKFC